MSFLDRIMGRLADPTVNWGAFSLPIPDFDLATMRFGTLRFGDGLDAAAFLGRPNRVTWTQRQYCELLYASGGFQIDYDGGRFAYLAFFVGPDEHLPQHEALRFCRPRLCGCTPDGTLLSRDTDRKSLERLFGPAEGVDTDPDETILFYGRLGVRMEFEVDGGTGRLKRWNLYPR